MTLCVKQRTFFPFCVYNERKRENQDWKSRACESENHGGPVEKIHTKCSKKAEIESEKQKRKESTTTTFHARTRTWLIGLAAFLKSSQKQFILDYTYIHVHTHLSLIHI